MMNGSFSEPIDVGMNPSSPGQYVHHLANDIFRCIFVNEASVILLGFH